MVEQKKRRVFNPMTAAALMAMFPVDGRPRQEEPEVDYAEEYTLILAKKSRLPASERARIVRIMENKQAGANFGRSEG